MKLDLKHNNESTYFSNCLLFCFSGSIGADCCWLLQHRLKSNRDQREQRMSLLLKLKKRVRQNAARYLQLELTVTVLYQRNQIQYIWVDEQVKLGNIYRTSQWNQTTEIIQSFSFSKAAWWSSLTESLKCIMYILAVDLTITFIGVLSFSSHIHREKESSVITYTGF